MRVALVHDWLTGMRGGERLLHELALLFPDAELHTLIHVPGSTTEAIESRRIHASSLSRLPGAARHYRKLLPLFPWAVERLRIADVDLVISTSHAFAKGVRVPPHVPHLCYCMTPMRYVWDQIDAYLGRGVRRAAAAPLVAYLRAWDRRTSDRDRVTRFVAISRTVAERIRRHYDRVADVLYPPVDMDRIPLALGPPEDFYLLVGGFVPYKNEALAVEAFRGLPHPLVVAGDGPTRRRIERMAPPNVTFLGRVPDATLASLYGRARGLVYPQEEDFGIVPLEAQAAGRPVVALGRGGATETVVPPGSAAAARSGPTGVWFDAPAPGALADGVRTLEKIASDLDPRAIRAHAAEFALPRFRHKLRAAIERILPGAGEAPPGSRDR